MPKVSVIINTFNRPYMLKQAVASIYAQTLDDWELVLAVDHKEDTKPKKPEEQGVISYSRRLFRRWENILLDFTDLEPGDQSLNRFAHNINRAFRLCTGDYVTYLCDDDLLMPWRLSVFSRVLDENPEYAVVYGKQMVWDIPTQRFTEERPASDVLPIHPEGLSPFGRVNHNSIMHRRECFDIVGGWVENAPARLGDAYFFARLNQRWAFHPIDCVGEIMRMGEQNCWSGKPQSESEKVNVGAFA
ncbi:MAG TPA: glycosyltransferase family A protein [Pyrinomonadaceae bacterium]|nr:glycosyltransferase family A protein [Pyrinomonadaceae bacterium]